MNATSKAILNRVLTATGKPSTSAEALWNRMSEDERSRWISKDVFIRAQRRQAKQNEKADQQASQPTRSALEAQAKRQWQSMSADEKEKWANEDIFVRAYVRERMG